MKLTVIVFTLMAATAMSQSTFSGNDLTPVPGEQFNIVNFDDGAEGSGGANQTWNFTSISTITDTMNMEVVTPEQTAFENDFPNANLAIHTGGGNFIFLKSSAAALQEVGNAYSDEEGDFASPYTDLKDMLRFPLTTTSAFTDNYYTSTNYMGMLLETYGKVEVATDGWGTLQTPAGTFTQVIRVRTVDTMQNIMNYMGFLDTTYQILETYHWYQAGTHWPLFGITHLSGDDENKTYGFYTVPSSVTGIENENLLARYKLYPNPVASELVIENMSEDSSQPLFIKVYDATGKEVLHDNPTANSISRYSVEHLMPGIYLVQFRQGTIGYQTKFVKL